MEKKHRNAAGCKGMFVGCWMAIACLVGVLGGQSAQGVVVDVRKRVSAMTPIAIVGIENGDDLVNVVASDLAHSGSFEVLPESGPQTPRQAYTAPMVWPWQPYKGAILVTGLLHQDASKTVVRLRLFDVATGKLAQEGTLLFADTDRRRMAHKIANAIYERLTGYAGYFDSQIFYTAEFGKSTQKMRRIAVIDYDGANAMMLTPGSANGLMPRTSPTRPMVSYSSLGTLGGRKNVNILRDLRSGQERVLPSQGLDFAPRFTPKGDGLVFCSARQGRTSIYKYDLASGAVRQMTHSPYAIEVSPSYHPDGSRFVFASDRNSRNPKLYISQEGGAGEAQLLSGRAGSYFAPVWSPDGRWIAFVRRHKGAYYLGVMDAQGRNERMLATNHVIDSPSWAPNSRLLVFSSQERRFGPFFLYTVDLTGRSLRRIQTPGHSANHPNWALFPRDER